MAKQNTAVGSPAKAGADGATKNDADLAQAGEGLPPEGGSLVGALAGGEADAGQSDESGSTTEVDGAPANSDQLHEWLGAIEWPLEVVLRNNGHIAHSEAATGAFVAAGGAQPVSLHDADQAARFISNIATLNATHHADSPALFADGVPVELFTKG